MPEPPGYGVYLPAAGTALASPPESTPAGGVLGERGSEAIWADIG
jgi:hypothetical protein